MGLALYVSSLTAQTGSEIRSNVFAWVCLLKILYPVLPRILFSTPFAVLTYFLIWYVPPFEQGKVIWYLIFYCLFQSMQTVSTLLILPRVLFLIFAPLSNCVCVCVFIFTVLPCAIFSPHHVHQQRPEREGFCHCLSYVTPPVWSKGFTCVLSFILWHSIPMLPSGMMVEVLGTVLGTAIQGQIVGGASDCPTELDVHNSGNSSRNNTSIVSLEDTVRVLSPLHDVR